MSETVIEFSEVVKTFQVKKGFFGKREVIKALNKVSFSVKKGEIFGIIGESGSGKTTIAKILTGLYSKDSGEVRIFGKEIGGFKRSDWKKMRRRMQMVFQDPYSSFNPVLKIKTQLKEVILFNRDLKKSEINREMSRLMETVGLSFEHLLRYPHELSGGQRQRIAIARALAVKPEILIADEITSALDRTIGTKILKLLLELKEKFNLTVIFISHDLESIKRVASRVMVVFAGKVVEEGDAESVIVSPLHPYSKELKIAFMPDVETLKSYSDVEDEVFEHYSWHTRCAFFNRCPEKMDVCGKKTPQLVELEGKKVRCFRYF